MVRASLVRRSTALLAITALVSAAGLASGALVGVASAQAATSVTPKAVSNAPAATTAFTIAGSGFQPAIDSVKLEPTKAGDEVGAITGTVDKVNSTATALKVTAPLNLAAPEPYNVRVSQGSGPAMTDSVCPNCLIVTNPARPTVSAVVRDSGTGFMTISGTNFARGAKVEFYASNGATSPVYSPDPAMTFVAGRDTTTTTGTTHTTGYPSPTTLKGHYTPAGGAQAGIHYLKVSNLDGQGSSELVEFWQPKFSSLAPAALGEGASSVPLTFVGDGIRTGSSMAISQCSNSTADMTVGSATVAGDHKSITAPVSVGTNTSCSFARTVGVTGPDGGYVNGPSALAIHEPPSPSSLDITTFGQGASQVAAVVTGTGFLPGITFSVNGGGVTIVTLSVPNATTANVSVSVDPDAIVSNRDTLTATNADHGTGTVTGDGTPVVSPYPLVVTPGPVITNISPGATTAGSTTSVTLTGANFDNTNGMVVEFGSGITTNLVTVIDANTATVSITAAPGAAAGPRNVKLTNKGDKGSSTCTACFGIDSLSISNPAGPNTNNAFDETFSVPGGGSLATATAARLQKSGSPAYQPDIVGTNFVPGTTATATFDLTSAAPGAYNAVVSTPGGPLSCTGCFTISAPDFTATSVSPATGGTGAVDFPITLTGTSFSRGMRITIPGATVSETSFVSPTSVTAKVTIPANAPPGQVDVTVSSADGSFSHMIAKGYTIVAGPTVSSASTDASDHKSIGQGATNRQVSIVGTGFSAASRVSFSGSDVTATTAFVNDTHLTASVSVGGTATPGDRDVTVTNTDNGGTGTKASLVTITAKPSPTLVDRPTLVAGQTVDLVISGQGFKGDSVVTIPGATVTGTAVTADGTQLTRSVSVPGNAAPGARSLTVSNSDGGTGTCTCTINIAVPTALSNLQRPVATAGYVVGAFGKLINSNTGIGIGGASIRLTLAPAIGSGGSTFVTTDSAGNWAYHFRPNYNTNVSVSYPGDSTHLPAGAPTRGQAIGPRILVSAPRNNATSSYRTVLAIQGSVAPRKAGYKVVLYRVSGGRLKGVAQTRIASNNGYRFLLRLARGNYAFRVGLPATPGNISGLSRQFIVHRR